MLWLQDKLGDVSCVRTTEAEPVEGLIWVFFSIFACLRRFGAQHSELSGDLDPGHIFSEPPAFGATGRVWLMDQLNDISSDPSLIKGSARNTVKQF